MVTIVVYILLLIALTPPLGVVHVPRLQARGDRSSRGDRLPADRREPQPRAVVAALRRLVPVVQRPVDAAPVRDVPPPEPPADQPGRARGGRSIRLVQHVLQLHHQHQLAGLRRRDHDDLPQPDARADLPELRVGGGRHGRARRALPRVRRRQDATSSATSGATSSAGPSTSCSRSRRSWPCCSCRRASSRRSVRRHPRPASRGSARRSPGDPSPVRSRSSSSGPTAAGSST